MKTVALSVAPSNALQDPSLGLQLVAEFYCAKNLDSEEHITELLMRVAEFCNANVLFHQVHRFSPQGLSAIAVLSTSHIAVHTWPEHGILSLDTFTCGLEPRFEEIRQYVADTFIGHSINFNVLSRGVPRDVARSSFFAEGEPASPFTSIYPAPEGVHSFQSKVQTITSFTSPGAGSVLALDGIVQVADVDAFVYHELLSHPALYAHENPRRVGIVGGGDGHLALEVLKHEIVEELSLFELDEAVIATSQQLFPAVDVAFHDPRTTVHIGDAFKTLQSLDDNSLDVLLCDLPDPIGQAARLFGAEFYAECHRVLADDGIVVTQAGSVHFHPDHVRRVTKAMGEHFSTVELASGAIPTYPGSWWTFAIGTNGSACSHANAERADRPTVTTRLYDRSCHAWFFMPEVVRAKVLG